MVSPRKGHEFVWLNTEFNGFGGELISLAMVDEDNQSVYFALPCEHPTAWVAEHVLPVLGCVPSSRRAAQTAVRLFLHRSERVTIVANWPEDIKHFCAFMVDGPSDCLITPPLTFELRVDLVGTAERSSTPHNALQDAIALRDLYRASPSIA